MLDGMEPNEKKSLNFTEKIEKGVKAKVGDMSHLASGVMV